MKVFFSKQTLLKTDLWSSFFIKNVSIVSKYFSAVKKSTVFFGSLLVTLLLRSVQTKQLTNRQTDTRDAITAA